MTGNKFETGQNHVFLVNPCNTFKTNKRPPKCIYLFDKKDKCIWVLNGMNMLTVICHTGMSPAISA